jgi:hypothetical protein
MQQKPDDANSQADKFRDLARDLECDESEKAFEEKVRKVASNKAAPPPNPRQTD